MCVRMPGVALAYALLVPCKQHTGCCLLHATQTLDEVMHLNVTIGFCLLHDPHKPACCPAGPSKLRVLPHKQEAAKSLLARAGLRSSAPRASVPHTPKTSAHIPPAAGAAGVDNSSDLHSCSTGGRRSLDDSPHSVQSSGTRMSHSALTEQCAAAAPFCSASSVFVTHPAYLAPGVPLFKAGAMGVLYTPPVSAQQQQQHSEGLALHGEPEGGIVHGSHVLSQQQQHPGAMMWSPDFLPFMVDAQALVHASQHRDVLPGDGATPMWIPGRPC